MKASLCSLTLLFIFFSGFAEAQQPRRENLPPTLFGSVSQGAPTGTVLRLSLSDAIDRALRYNLGTVISEQDTRGAKAQRLRTLSDLLPRINGEITQTVQQTNLAAFGFNGFPGQSPVVGPFSVFDARARITQSVVDLKLLHDLRADTEKLNASTYSQQDIRELVVLITTELYLEAVTGGSRVDAARAQVNTAQAVYSQAGNLKSSGVVAGIDVLRAQVQLQARQQRLVSAANELAKDRLSLARAIGMSLSQDFMLTDTLVTVPATLPNLDETLSAALESRPDYLHANALVRAAEESRKAAGSRRLPTVQFTGDYGDIGRSPGFSHGTVTLQAKLSIPIYAGGRVRAETLESDSILTQRKAEAASLRDRIEYEIRSASLDIQAAAEQLKVAQGTRDLAQEQIAQARDRFAAGVANSLELVQAQEAIATADENYISSLYSLNVAQASLARATGAAEKTIKSFFGGK
ncbi:MAG TPA: TolC family protein [Terriglobia bacterium]|nr:TolC family protein [Terriglobia bacterium]